MKLNDLFTAIDAGSSQTSPALDLGDYFNVGITISFSSGTLNGTLKLQGSVDNSTWVDVPSSSQSVVAGDAHMYAIVSATYRFVRIVYTASSGTGTMTAKTVIKETRVVGA